jgi:hypothetical protein
MRQTTVNNSGTKEAGNPTPPTSGSRGTDTTAAPRLLDLKAAGAYLSVSYWTVRDLVFAGALPTVKIPCPRAGDGRAIRRILIDRKDLDAFIENNKDFEQE